LQRDLNAMEKAPLDLLIIGGGISGSTIAWDAALRGLRVALVEKRDFSHATSSATSKLVHGGLRYLANYEFGLIRESLKERRIWETIAPHMVDPLPFLVPNYGKRSAKLFMRIGFDIYDLLSFNRKRLTDKSKRLPRHKRISAKKALKLAPGLNPKGLIGGIIYYDCQMYSPERLGLECLLGAAEHGAHIANYAEAVEITNEGGRITGAIVEDTLTGSRHKIKAAMTINAGGPWADYILKDAEKGDPSRHLIRSKGIHIITRSLTDDMAIAATVEGDHVMFLPWRGHTIIGTTDSLFEEKPDNLSITEGDIEGLLAKAKKAYPKANLSREDVKHFYVGLRPLVDPDNDPTNNEDTYGASRAAEVVDHEAENNLPGLISAIGGKWTTARHVASQVVDKVIGKLPDRSLRAMPCKTQQTPIFAGDIDSFAEFLENLTTMHPDWPRDIIENLAKNYGTETSNVIALTRQDPELKARLSEARPEIAAEVIYAVRTEMAQNLDDVLFRRTGIGTIGDPGEEVLEHVAKLMGQELGWHAGDRLRQIKEARRRFQVDQPLGVAS